MIMFKQKNKTPRDSIFPVQQIIIILIDLFIN